MWNVFKLSFGNVMISGTFTSKTDAEEFAGKKASVTKETHIVLRGKIGSYWHPEKPIASLPASRPLNGHTVPVPVES